MEFLDNFSISDVSLLKMKTKVSLQSRPEECLIENQEETAQNSEDSQQFSYSLKIKFHANIFGTFKQTVVFDFGVRPLLAKVSLNVNCC